LTMALVFVPVVALHLACLAHPAEGAKPAAASAGGAGGNARG
jgi:hypothetical protein